ncbi:MAG: exodeoxyribonuclease VII small subunit [Spirochaetaceae bacterium]|nr:MAG: exodeoxyribonuclease VII small subunit [Spirochaetaceae bacterium]
MKNFEERLARLEELAEKLRDGEIPLHEATASFEEGVKLARDLEKDLGKIEKRIEILINKPDTPEEPPILELFPELNDLRPNGT